MGGLTTLHRRSVVQTPARRAVVQRGNVAECTCEPPRRNVATPQRYPLLANGTQLQRERARCNAARLLGLQHFVALLWLLCARMWRDAFCYTLNTR